MKTVLKIVLLVLVFSVLSSCSGLANKFDYEKSTGDVSFTFRAGTGLNGSTLSIFASDGAGSTVEKQTATITAGKTKYPFTFSNMPIGKTISFRATVTNSYNYTLYEGSVSHKIAAGNNRVALDLKANGGYFLWRRRKSGSNPIEGACDVIYQKPKAGQNIGISRNFNVIDFSFAKNGNIWCVNDSGEVGVIKHGDGTFSQKASSMSNVNTIAVGEKLIFAGGTNSASSLQPVLYLFDNDTSQEALTPTDVSSNVSNLGIEGISEMAISGSDIYIGTNITDPDNPDKVSFKIFKGNIDESNKSLTFSSTTPIFASTTKNEFGTETSFAITDMQIVDGNLYVLALDKNRSMVDSNTYGGSANSRGALIKINGSSSEVKYLHSKVSELDKPADFAPNNHNYMLKEGATELQTCLIGPRKFIAVVPKKLVIADDGAVYDNAADKNIKSKKRIVTVSLDDFSFESVDVSEELFDGEVTGCGFYSLKRE